MVCSGRHARRRRGRGGVAYEVRQDADLDGVVDAGDATHANSITGGAGGYQTLGRGVLSSSGVESRVGYAGYRYDRRLGSTGRHWYPARHRWYMAEVGRWMTRDPWGFVDGPSLYGYVRNMAMVGVDPTGLFCIGPCSVPMPTPFPSGPMSPWDTCSGGMCSIPIAPSPSDPDWRNIIDLCMGVNCGTAIPTACPGAPASWSPDEFVMAGIWGWTKRQVVRGITWVANSSVAPWVPVVRIIPNCFGNPAGSAVADYAGLGTTAAECASALPMEDPTLACRNRIRAQHSRYVSSTVISNVVYDIVEIVIGTGFLAFPEPFGGTKIIGGVLVADGSINGACAIRQASDISAGAAAAAAALCVCPPAGGGAGLPAGNGGVAWAIE
jgi:RHS repeat-associated protein